MQSDCKCNVDLNRKSKPSSCRNHVVPAVLCKAQILLRLMKKTCGNPSQGLGQLLQTNTKTCDKVQWFGARQIPRKLHEISTKSPRKLHENSTNSTNSGSSARPWTVVQDLSELDGTFAIKHVQGVAKNTVHMMKSPVRLAVQTRLQSSQLVKRAVFTRDLFTRSAGCPVKGTSPKATLLEIRKALDRFNFLRHVVRAILSVRPKCSRRCVSLKKFHYETCTKPQAHNQKLNRANLYENEMV